VISFDKHSQIPDYTHIDMIFASCSHCNISTVAGLGAINSQFYRVLSSKVCYISQMVSLILLLKNKCYPPNIFLKTTRDLFNKENILFWNFSVWSPPSEFVVSCMLGTF
jgi:hypothetical protein